MQKHFSDIKRYGKIKPYFDKVYSFNSIDIETIDNELFLFGYIDNNKYKYTLDNFYNTFNDFLIKSIQDRKDIVTWSKYDNTHLIKLLLKVFNDDDINIILKRIGKVTPIFDYEYTYNGAPFNIQVVNIIKDSVIFKINDYNMKPRTLVIYNIKNLYHTDLEATAKNYDLSYYSKIGIEYHIIDKNRFNSNLEYKRLVIESNRLDNKVIIDIIEYLIKDFKILTGVVPKSIYTAGSLARSYLLSRDDIGVQQMSFDLLFGKHRYKDKLLEYSMASYHGGKIDSYILGYVKEGYIKDITSAYPSAIADMPYLTNKVYYGNDLSLLDNYYYYAFIKCNVYIDSPDFSHPLIVRSPINLSNLSPYGYLENIIITKIEYDFLKENNIQVDVIDYVAIDHIEIKPYNKMINELFNNRMKYNKSNKSLADLIKTILNSLYGIKYELTPLYVENEFNNKITYNGLRAGDFFNPIEASYITAITRTKIARSNNEITNAGGKILLNMTDSIIYTGDVKVTDYVEGKKILGLYEKPEPIKDIIILGAGRYEYIDVIKDRYVIKNRGFNVRVRDKSFYNTLDFSKKVKVNTNTFVTYFRATTNKYNFKHLGWLVDDDYLVDPFNLGGKRIPLKHDINVLKEYTDTIPIKIEKGLL